MHADLGNLSPLCLRPGDRVKAGDYVVGQERLPVREIRQCLTDEIRKRALTLLYQPGKCRTLKYLTPKLKKQLQASSSNLKWSHKIQHLLPHHVIFQLYYPVKNKVMLHFELVICKLLHLKLTFPTLPIGVMHRVR